MARTRKRGAGGKAAIVVGLTGAVLAGLGPSGFGQVPDVSDYDVVWTTPSDGPAGSMPLGNGDVSLNVWVEPSGDLLFYVGKTDSWGDNGRLLKVGRVRVSLEPNLLAEGAEFRQTLDLRRAEVRVELTRPEPAEAGAVTQAILRVWVDANHPVVHVTAKGDGDLVARAIIEPWRTAREELPSLEVSDVHLDRSQPGSMHAPTIVEPDTILTDLDDRIGWLHHNVKSVGPELTMRLQGLGDCLDVDPLLHRTFGGVLTAPGGRRLDERTLTTAPGPAQRLDLHVLTRHPATPQQWLEAVEEQITTLEKRSTEDRRRAHEAWWTAFWDRSWIHAREPEPAVPVLYPANDHPLRLGIDQGGANRLLGQLGRVSLLEATLEPAEIAKLAQGGREPLAPRDGLRGCWTDVEPGWTVPDSQAWSLPGPWTLEVWVLPEELPASGGRIVDDVTPGGSDGFLLDTHPGNSLRLIVGRSTLVARDLLEPGRWHHVAATADPLRGELVLFHDGEAVARAALETDGDAFVVSRGYQLQRFLNACAGRGHYPIKFNGSIFTVPHSGAPGDADYRRWGPGYWWQNTRLPYIGMCTSGDFDLLQSLFRLYTEEMLEVSRARTRRYFGHGGTFYSECVYFWGAVFSETYGWTPFEDRDDKLQTSGWHKWEWVAGPELVWMLLDCYEHTLDEELLHRRVLPTAREVLTFFDEHYELDVQGRLHMFPSQAVETWWDCTNPMPELAGLHAVTARLLALSEELTSAGDRAFWRSLQGKLPPLPTHEVEGVRMLAPAERFEQKRNIENPELYAVFPFRLITAGKPDVELGRAALEHRWDRGNFGWRQDDVFMAYLGLTDQARSFLSGRARNKHPGSRFPAFWGPNYDWIPDQDHGGILVKALQAMLLQCDGETIHLLPAWPRAWNVSFRLHAPHRTVIEGEVQDGRLRGLRVMPPDRRDDLRLGEGW